MEAKEANREWDGEEGADEHEDDEEEDVDELLLLPPLSEKVMLLRRLCLARLWAARRATSKPLEELDSSSLSNASCEEDSAS